MANTIATSLCLPRPYEGESLVGPGLAPVALFIAVISPIGEGPAVNTSLQLYQQSPNSGVWSGPFPLTSPMFTEGGVGSVVGCPNYLFALCEGTICASAFNQQGDAPEPTDWTDFVLIPMPLPVNPNNFISIDDFAVVSLIGEVLIVAIVEETPPEGGSSAMSLQSLLLPLASSDPTNFQAAFTQGGGWQTLPLRGGPEPFDPILAPTATALYTTSLTPTICAVVYDEGLNASRSWQSTDGVYWNETDLPTTWATAIAPAFPSATLLTPGYPDPGALKLIVFAANPGSVSGALPTLLSSTDGVTWSREALWVQDDLLPLGYTFYVSGATGFGPDGNLHVIALAQSNQQPLGGKILPCLISQSTTGYWNYQGPLPGAIPASAGLISSWDPDYWTEVGTPVAVGMGWCSTGNALQAALLTDQNRVFIVWQDPAGTWHWYPGLHGTGLP
jgi:hypothetical protein